MKKQEVKLCECGCGKPAPIAPSNNKSKGWVKGQPLHFIKGHYNARVPLEGRFWSRVNKQGPLPSKEATKVHPDIAGTRCWEWTGLLDKKGYGEVSVPPYTTPAPNTRMQGAHRVAWFLETGTWPSPQALHKCDNPKCVRFSHLFEGTNEDNMQDRKNKGGYIGQNCGEDSGTAKLTWPQVRRIRKEVSMGAKP